MSIDTTLPDRISIKDLAIPKPWKSELPFDPERDIPKEEWEDAKIMLRESQDPSNSSYMDFGERLSNMLILFPERKDELEIPPFEELDQTQDFVFARHIKLLYPGLVTEEVIERNNSGYKFQDIKKVIEDKKDDEAHWMTFGGDLVWDAFILYPESFGEIRALNGLYDTLQKTAHTMKKKGNWDKFAEFKLNVKLLGHDPEISQDEWKAMLNRFQRQPSYHIKLGARMKMLAAKEIKMTYEGLRVTTPNASAPLAEKPPQPVARRF